MATTSLPELHTQEEEDIFVLTKMLHATEHSINTLKDPAYNALMTENEVAAVSTALLSFPNANIMAREMALNKPVEALALYRELKYWHEAGQI